MQSEKKKRSLSSFQVICIGFLLMILTGSLLLTLPISSASDQWTSFGDALFTATSATCVTGLVVQNTATYWSLFGQLIILLLIQVGGMGVITMAMAFSLLMGQTIGLSKRTLMQESISAPRVGGIVKMTGFIIRGTLIIEGIGALLLLPVFLEKYSFLKALWYSIFHSISAFCNAGFDLLGETTEYVSLMDYYNNPFLIIPISLLIIVGGIGFLTWQDVRDHKWHFRKYCLQSKVILTTTAILILLPFLYFFFLEFQNPQWAYMSLPEKLLNAFFQAITPRTAGFNAIDMAQLSESGQLLTIVLMLTGGAPGSTAGGMKVTTLAVLFLISISVFKRKKDTTAFGRQLAEDRARYALTILMMYVVLFVTGAIIISHLENVPILLALFETGSAIATVGLSLGLTPGLSLVSQFILIILMFFGRVGGLTLIFSAVQSNPAGEGKLPQEKITLG